jgi:KAP family P-loop domain
MYGHETPKTPFRAFDAEHFHETASWKRLARILTSNGGCYGLYGPRGAGKSWLMLMAIEEANKKGLGLWYPCPSQYDASAFLSMLADNLANVVERRFMRNNLRARITQRLQLLLSIVIGIPIVVAVVAYVVHGLNSKATTSGTVFSPVPGWLWWVVAVAIVSLLTLFVTQIIWEHQPTGRLVREASALREHIRFTASMKVGTEVGVGGGNMVTGSLRRSRERALDERPTTIASLVYEFRSLAELIVKTLHEPVVIGIDELDKIERAEVVLKLLRDIKGIFEIANVNFLVSVSEEAATALQLGPLRTNGRNEFNSSFYTVIELPPLTPAETLELLRPREVGITERRAHILCLLGAGNFREIVRLAERMDLPLADPDWGLLVTTLDEEAKALLREIIGGSLNHEEEVMSAEAVAGAWRALPHAAFSTVDSFVVLSGAAIDSFWEPRWTDDLWKKVFQESWRRLLIRLFIAGSVIAHQGRPGTAGDPDTAAMIADLRAVVIMATHSTAVARLMLEARFGGDLSSPYQPADDV